MGRNSKSIPKNLQPVMVTFRLIELSFIKFVMIIRARALICSQVDTNLEIDPLSLSENYLSLPRR